MLYDSHDRKMRRMLKVCGLVAILAALYFGGYALGYYTAPYTKDFIGAAYNSAPTEAAKEVVRQNAAKLCGIILVVLSGLMLYGFSKIRRSK